MSVAAALTHRVYQLLLLCLLPLARRRGAQQNRERNGERFAEYPPALCEQLAQMAAPRIWIHAASVGESLAAISVIRQLQTQSSKPLFFVVTTVTATAAEQVTNAFTQNNIVHIYAPYDLAKVVSRFIAVVKPALCLLIETELWPETVKQLARKNIPQLLVNGRLSQQSAQRYARFSRLAEPMLARIDQFLVQNSDTARRFIELGVEEKKIHLTGSIKFDLTISTAVKDRAALLKTRWHQQHSFVWLVASTHGGEEAIALSAFKAIKEKFHDALLVLVPRHPQRFDEVAALLDAYGLRYARQSANPTALNQTDVLLGDTMGELLAFYGACDVATVGGSLVDIGGHNLIEPAAWALPITSGPFLRNFQEIADQLLAVEGLRVANSADSLAIQITHIMTSPELKKTMGQSAAKIAQQNRGALQKTTSLILQQLPQD